MLVFAYSYLIFLHSSILHCSLLLGIYIFLTINSNTDRNGVVVYPLPHCIMRDTVKASQLCWRSPMLFAQMASKDGIPTRTVHKSRGDRVVHMCLGLNRCCVFLFFRGDSWTMLQRVCFESVVVMLL